jgi:hypothetical protein
MMNMNAERRSLLSRWPFAALVLAPAWLAGASRRQSAPPSTVIPAPQEGTANEKGLKGDIARLSQLVQELKKEADKTDSSTMLNLALVHKAEEIEKLAHQLKLSVRS